MTRSRRLRSRRDSLARLKALGFSDARLDQLGKTGAGATRAMRLRAGLRPVYARVDTCAAEFEARTNYLYSTWGDSSEVPASDRKRIMILGGGPNRIGQGIEFDYCCVHATFACRELGYDTIMVNCNPETVSTDYDTSDRLYFEPLTFEDVMSIVAVEKPDGVMVQFGGQTPLKLALPLARAGVPIVGTSADAIDRAEDRERFDELLEKLGLRRPRGGIARGVAEAFEVADRIGYPVLVRPSYVLGGRAMETVHSRTDLGRYMKAAFEAVEDAENRTILVDEFLKDAIEVDVDCVADKKSVLIGGVMQHIEEAGVHSGDSSLVLPAHALPPEVLATIRSATRALALELEVVGLMNVQFAVRGSAVYVIEVNPRASRTVPFVSKAIGVPLAKIAAKVMVGMTLEELGATREIVPRHVAVKESVFPFHKFPGVDTILGPEMRSTGEVMGIAESFPAAFLKAQLGTGLALPDEGCVFISVRDDDKPAACEVGRRLVELGYELVATGGTQRALERAGVTARYVNKATEGRPHVIDALVNGEIAHGDQHHRRRARDSRQQVAPASDAGERDPVLHHHRGGHRRRRGGRGAARRSDHRVLAAGVPRADDAAEQRPAGAVTVTRARVGRALLVTTLVAGGILVARDAWRHDTIRAQERNDFVHQRFVRLPGPDGELERVVVVFPRRPDGREQPPGERYPLLVALHGRAEAARGPSRGILGWYTDYELPAAFGALARGRLTSADYHSFVRPAQLDVVNARLEARPFRGVMVVMPYTPDLIDEPVGSERVQRYGAWLSGPLLRTIREEFPQAARTRDGTGIDGVSLGGMLSLEAGFTHPDAFGAVGGIQPAIRGRERALADAAAGGHGNRRPQRIQLLTSEADPFLPPTRTLAEDLRSARISYRLAVYPGPHGRDFNRGPGGIEMLRYFDEVLAREPASP